jgi:hypothetical protein
MTNLKMPIAFKRSGDFAQQKALLAHCQHGKCLDDEI